MTLANMRKWMPKSTYSKLNSIELGALEQAHLSIGSFLLPITYVPFTKKNLKIIFVHCTTVEF